MAENSFYIHEDEWGMITIMPAENLARTRDISDEARTFSGEHFDGSAWTEMYVIPEETHSIALRKVPVSALQEIFGDSFTPVSQVKTGYSTHQEAVNNGFALVSKQFGVMYGSYRDGLITSLYVARFTAGEGPGVEQFIDNIVSFGETYDLILADWWQDKIVDMRKRSEVARYVLDDGDEEDVL